MPMFLMLAALAQAAATTPPDPQTCSTYVGRVVQPTTIDAAMLHLSKLPRIKGEYETSEQFAARQATAWPAAHAPLIIATPLDHKYIHYDADAGVLSVGLYAIDNRNVSYDHVFGSGTPLEGQVEFGYRGNYDIVVSEREVTTGHYIGSNGFGARGRVDRITRITKAIFERGASDYSAELFPTADPNKAIVALPMTPVQAQKLKPVLTAAVVITPKAPFFASGTKDWGPATLEAPEEVIQHVSVVVADIKCGLLLDAGHKVVATVTGQ